MLPVRSMVEREKERDGGRNGRKEGGGGEKKENRGEEGEERRDYTQGI